MTLHEHFDKVMLESVNIALATSVNQRPNVRVVTFAYDPTITGRFFFTTFKGSQKGREFEQNPHVACMPLPMTPEAELQVRIFGTVQKSNLTLDQIIALIAKKIPGDADTIKAGGDMMDIYEIHFPEAFVTVGMTEAQLIAF